MADHGSGPSHPRGKAIILIVGVTLLIFALSLGSAIAGR